MLPSALPDDSPTAKSVKLLGKLHANSAMIAIGNTKYLYHYSSSWSIRYYWFAWIALRQNGIDIIRRYRHLFWFYACYNMMDILDVTSGLDVSRLSKWAR
jgi:hypothetical protein